MGLVVLVVPADNVPSGLKGKAFLAIHAEGSEKPCTTGPSLGYANAATSPYAMHAVGLGTSRALGYRYAEFRPDKFTANMANYYMFSKVETDHLTGLLEVGKLTCKESEDRLVAGAIRLGINIAQALNFIVSL